MNRRDYIIYIALLFSIQATAQTVIPPTTAPGTFQLENNTTEADCSNPIASFPYRETFETSAGGWTAGGTASDWTRGTPTKAVISTAGEGNNSWITGGLSNSSYNNGENSFLESPCFNFSSLVYPRISFRIFWEMERRFDGASLEYSTDGGSVWYLVGTVNSNGNCEGENWYNTPGITYLGNSEGWSGNRQANNGSCLGGNGSGGWLTASHSLSPLAGQAQVVFRFRFGAGTTCNAYDGFAIDDVKIFEAPPNRANFNYTCKPGRVVDFTSLSLCATSSAWNFGDPASGVNNTSTTTNPSHTFSAPGVYTVTLTSNFISGPPSTETKQITILDVTTNIDQPVSCAGTQTATLSATASGSSLPYTYLWNTTPSQSTAVISNVGAGTYSVTVSSGTACAVTASIIVPEPVALVAAPVVTPEKCTPNSGSIFSNVTGGTLPYTYIWSNGASGANISNLAAGSYSLQVRDSRGCNINLNNISVAKQQNNLVVTLGADTAICAGQQLTLSPGAFSSYLWQDNSSLPVFIVTATGRYSVQVTDPAGCSGVANISVTVDCPDIFFPSGITPNNDGRNDVFGPVGNNLFAIKNYQLRVFNRYGEQVFYSTNPFYKWDGKYKSVLSGNETFAWMASYTTNGKDRFKKGTVTIIR